MIYGSVCSGIEAATVAWHPLGWKPAFFSEIDPAARAILQHHYPTIPLHGDFTTIKDGDYEPIELLVGGTPCQDFSIAGKRLGISAPRGNLALEFLALAARLRPRWLVFENVPGLLSNWSGIPAGEPRGHRWQGAENSDFAAFLGAIRECGYLGCWRSLDAQFAGLAQRRERLFFVGYLGDWRPPAAVLFERESLRGDSPPRREAGQGITGTLNARTEGGGGLGTDFECMGGLTAHALTGEGFDASEDGTGRGTPLIPEICGTLSDGAHNGGGLNGQDAYSGRIFPVAFDCKASGRNGFGEGDISPTLRKMDDAQANDGGHAAVAVNLRGREGGAMAEMASLRSASGGSSRSYVQQMAVRRLTPRECEKLQGFEPGYTSVPYRGRMMADGPRYKMLGNSMAVPVMAQIGKRIALVEELLCQKN